MENEWIRSRWIACVTRLRQGSGGQAKDAPFRFLRNHVLKSPRRPEMVQWLDGRGAGNRRQPTSRGVGLGLGFAVDEILQLLARLEVGHLLRRHIHLVAGLRVAAFPRLALPQAEAAEPAQFDLLAAVQRIDDAL